jgi:flagellar export protein FliJ
LQVGDARVHRGDATAADLLDDRRWLARLDETVKAAEQALAAAADRVAGAQAAEAGARDALAQATRERQAVEKHRETWLAEEERAEARRAEALLDDLATRKG